MLTFCARTSIQSDYSSTVRGTCFVRNEAGFKGETEAEIDDCIFEDNAAWAVDVFDGDLTITNSRFVRSSRSGHTPASFF